MTRCDAQDVEAVTWATAAILATIAKGRL